jgi:hypothetical protein
MASNAALIAAASSSLTANMGGSMNARRQAGKRGCPVLQSVR